MLKILSACEAKNCLNSQNLIVNLSGEILKFSKHTMYFRLNFREVMHK